MYSITAHAAQVSNLYWNAVEHACKSCCYGMQHVGDADEQGGSGDHANGVQRSGSGLGRNAPKRGRGRPGGGRGQMRGDMGMGGPMAPVGAGMMGGMQAMPGQMFVLAPGKPKRCSAWHLLPHHERQDWVSNNFIRVSGVGFAFIAC